MTIKRVLATVSVAAGCLLACAACAQQDDFSAFRQALNSAHGGETLTLPPGASGQLEITNLRFDTPVTITSADPRRPAKITSLKVVNSAGIKFENLEFSAPDVVVDASAQNPNSSAPESVGQYAEYQNFFQVLSSHNITFDHIDAHGNIHGTLATEGSGFLIRDSQAITIERSELQHFHNAIGHTNNEHLTITGNWFHNIRDDGIRGGGSSFLTITHNRFESFHPDADDTDHPDCIQVWTTNTTVSAHDIVVTDNLYVRGSGRSVQGVFINNEASVPYDRVTISNNVFAGAGYNGIVADMVHGLSVTGNTVARYPDQTSRLRVLKSDGAVVASNRAAEFGWTTDPRISDTNSHISRSKNQVIEMVFDNGRALAAAWRAKQNPAEVYGGAM